MALSIFQSAETSVREKHRQDNPAPECTVRHSMPAGEFHEATPYKLDIVHSYPVTAPNPDARRADFFATLSVVSKKKVV